MFERRALRAELKASADGGGFEGLAAAFHNVDESLYGDVIAPGAFAQDLPSFLADGFIGGMNHDWDTPIGRPTGAEERPEGLFVAASISDTAHGRDVRTLLRDGVVRKLSIGFKTLGKRYLEGADEVAAHWKEVGYEPTSEDVERAAHGVRLLTRVRLYEVSPVAVPANERARVIAVKGVVGFADLPLADRGRAWDGDAARGRVREWSGSSATPSAAFRRAFVWFGGEGESFSDYKLPIADIVDGELKAVPGAVFAAAAAVQGARGGLDVPEVELPGIRAHLGRYYSKMREMPPWEEARCVYGSFLALEARRLGVRMGG